MLLGCPFRRSQADMYSLSHLLSPTGCLRSIHAIRFPLLPHPHIVHQLEGAMSRRRLTSGYTTPLCEEQCMYSHVILSAKGGSPLKSNVCCMCDIGRLEKRCPYDTSNQDSYACLRWRDFHLWAIISASIMTQSYTSIPVEYCTPKPFLSTPVGLRSTTVSPPMKDLGSEQRTQMSQRVFIKSPFT